MSNKDQNTLPHGERQDSRKGARRWRGFNPRSRTGSDSDAALMPGMTAELSSLVIVLIWFIDVRTVASSVACTFRTGHGSTGVNVGIGIFHSPRLNKTLYIYRYLLFIRAAVHATPILNPPIHCQGVVAIVAIVAYPDTRLGPQ